MKLYFLPVVQMPRGNLSTSMLQCTLHAMSKCKKNVMPPILSCSRLQIEAILINKYLYVVTQLFTCCQFLLQK